MSDLIDQFKKERDEVLLEADLDKVAAFLKKWNPQLASPSRKVTEIMLHKAITAALSLPVAYRRASAHWLKRHGYRSWDDGDL